MLTADRGSGAMSAAKLHEILDPVRASVPTGHANGMTGGREDKIGFQKCSSVIFLLS